MWLEDLQRTVMPFVCPLVRGESMHLSRGQQEALALFLTTRAMVADFGHAAPHRGFSFEERNRLRTGGQIPERLVIWLAAYEGPRAFSYRTHDLALSPPPGNPSQDFNAQWVTMSIGRLAFRFWIMPRPDLRRLVLTHTDEFEGIIEILWPIQWDALKWPPRYWIDDESLTFLSTYLAFRAAEPTGKPDPTPEAPS